jgi:DNA-directed RNA polymerase specialized sigma subunit
LTINEKPTSVEPPSQDELRLRMARVLQSPKSRRMTTAVRQVAMVWFQGATQEEIAKKLKIDQSKASRRLDQTKTWLYRVF